METTPIKATHKRTASTEYLNAIVDDCTRRPPTGAWTIADLIARGVERNKARSVMLQAVADHELAMGKFKNKLYFWIASDDV